MCGAAAFGHPFSTSTVLAMHLYWPRVRTVFQYSTRAYRTDRATPTTIKTTVYTVFQIHNTAPYCDSPFTHHRTGAPNSSTLHQGHPPTLHRPVRPATAPTPDHHRASRFSSGFPRIGIAALDNRPSGAKDPQD